jgi:pyrroline-5-carboxylate reductase
MADALLGGFLEKRAFLNKNVVVTDIAQERLDFMENKYGVQVTECNTALLSQLKIIMLAVKP